MSEWSFRLQRHKGETTLRLYEVPIRWLVVERLAASMLGHAMTDRAANWLFAKADKRYRLLESITLDAEAADAIDPEWNRIWNEENDRA